MKTAVVGFIGPRSGITPAQGNNLKKALLWIHPVEVHHGMSVGADQAFHNIVRSTLPQCRIVGHPPLSNTFAAKMACDYITDRMGYVKRDLGIVDACTILIVATKAFRTGEDVVDVKTSQTSARFKPSLWKCIYYAKDAGKVVLILYPSGGHYRIAPRTT